MIWEPRLGRDTYFYIKTKLTDELSTVQRKFRYEWNENSDLVKQFVRTNVSFIHAILILGH